ncbi:MAG: hydrolase TatD [endosymbiont of Galathealinum brachiosum]|uniref:Hydrolase TatD n=1 Tax=endosymbiont of Galathealinum brachiosum TaxID=2200906 RepID=A0A370DJ60_9GAMM|nr:MAG: hydrolase TatD [endosymbiont of Galathealinum brachiosum]
MSTDKAETYSDLIDIGVNLTAKSFQKDLTQVINRATGSGVSQMVITGTNLQHSDAAIELCEKWPGVLFSTAGVHPHHAKEWTDKTAQEIYGMAQTNSVRAIGECGLDYNRNFSDPKDQRRSFEAQLELAADLRLPVFLHQRDAHADFMSILVRWRDQLTGGVAHCFTGTVEEAKAYLELDLMIGITGWLCDERRGQSLQKAVKEIPLSQLMIETDAPYLMPRDLPDSISADLQERRNEPFVLPHVCTALARYKDEEPSEVAKQTTASARHFFNLR